MSPVSEKASCIDDDDPEVGGPYVEEETPLASSSMSSPLHGSQPTDAHFVHPETRRSVNIAEADRRIGPHPPGFIHESSQSNFAPPSSYRTPWPVSVPVHHPGWPNPMSQVPAINPDTIGHNYPTTQYTSHQSASESDRHVSRFEQNIQSGQSSSLMSQRELHHAPEPGPLRAYRPAAFGSDNSSHPHLKLGYSQPQREPIHHQTLSHADPTPNIPPCTPHHSSVHQLQPASREAPHLLFATASQQPASYFDSGPTSPQVAFQQSQQTAFQSSHERHLHPNDHASLEPLQYPPWDSMPDSYDQLHSTSSGSTHYPFNSPPKPSGWRWCSSLWPRWLESSCRSWIVKETIVCDIHSGHACTLHFAVLSQAWQA